MILCGSLIEEGKNPDDYLFGGVLSTNQPFPGYYKFMSAYSDVTRGRIFATQVIRPVSIWLFELSVVYADCICSHRRFATNWTFAESCGMPSKRRLRKCQRIILLRCYPHPSLTRLVMVCPLSRPSAISYQMRSSSAALDADVSGISNLSIVLVP